MGETFVQAAEYAAAENARHNLQGLFTSNSSDGTNLTLTVDDDEPGIGVQSFYISGEDKLENEAARLYPTGLYAGGTSLAHQYKVEGRILTSHRMISSGLPLHPRAAVEGGEGGGLFDHSFTWQTIDGLGPVDEFILEIVDGTLTSVRAPYYDVVFERVEI